LQFGAEIYGHAGREAELEAIELSAWCLRAAGVHDLVFDLGDVRVVDALLQGLSLTPQQLGRLHDALAAKDQASLAAASAHLPDAVREGLSHLVHLYGDVDVLDQAERCLPPSTLLAQALGDLRWLAEHLSPLRLSFDLADLRGYAYYTGLRFSGFGAGRSGGARHELVRGGRYDEVGAVFGRKRPAVGFSLDLKDLSGLLPQPALQAAIRAPWSGDPALRDAIARLRSAGETVVCVLPGHEHEVDEFHCNRVLQQQLGDWVVMPLQA
jgi:ATP phosphoribosyltransferase regulatory subunit